MKILHVFLVCVVLVSLTIWGVGCEEPSWTAEDSKGRDSFKTWLNKRVRNKEQQFINEFKRKIGSMCNESY